MNPGLMQGAMGSVPEDTMKTLQDIVYGETKIPKSHNHDQKLETARYSILNMLPRIQAGINDQYENINRLGLLDDIEEMKGQIVNMQKDISSLKMTSPQYYTVRERNLAIFQRDAKGDSRSAALHVRAANKHIHELRAATDIQIYHMGISDDYATFKEIYGLSVERATFLAKNNNHSLLRIIDTMAECRVRGTVVPTALQAEFDSLIREIEARELSEPISNRNSKSRLSQACKAFWREWRLWQDTEHAL